MELIGGVAVIEKNRKHFLIRQARSKPNGGQWRHPGGRFILEETPIDGLKREIREEIGVVIEAEKKPVFVTESDYHEGNFGFFMARIKSGTIRIEKREIEDAGWFPISEIKKMNLMAATRRFYEQLK